MNPESSLWYKRICVYIRKTSRDDPLRVSSDNQFRMMLFSQEYAMISVMKISSLQDLAWATRVT